jgi:poly(3-hydroxyalkanoate) depolymerase
MTTRTRPPRSRTLETRTIDVAGQELRVYERIGDGRQPPLLLINGFGCSIEVMEPFMAMLEPSSAVICFDVPGIGGSPRPSRPYLLRDLSALTRRLLKLLEQPVVDALGVSWGGALAQQFALQHPRLCRRLVLVSTGPAPIMRPSLTMVRELIAPRRLDPERGREVASSLYGGRVKADPSLLDPLYRRLSNDRHGELYQQLALIGWTSLPFLRLIRQPTLILAGDDDRIVPMVNARIMNRLLPNADLHVFHDGHLGLVTSARELAGVVEAFRGADVAAAAA